MSVYVLLYLFVMYVWLFIVSLLLVGCMFVFYLFWRVVVFCLLFSFWNCFVAYLGLFIEPVCLFWFILLFAMHLDGCFNAARFIAIFAVRLMVCIVDCCFCLFVFDSLLGQPLVCFEFGWWWFWRCLFLCLCLLWLLGSSCLGFMVIMFG